TTTTVPPPGWDRAAGPARPDGPQAPTTRAATALTRIHAARRRRATPPAPRRPGPSERTTSSPLQPPDHDRQRDDRRQGGEHHRPAHDVGLVGARQFDLADPAGIAAGAEDLRLGR